MKHLIGQTRNGIPVYVDLIHSHVANHIAQQPRLLGLLAEALQKTKLHDTKASVEHDMRRTIGYSFIVKTTGSDSIFYAKLLRDDTYIRFIKNGKPSSTQYLSMVLHRDNGSYELHDAWVGRLNPPHPGTDGETAESKPFWETHAVISSNESLQLRTITKVCPY